MNGMDNLREKVRGLWASVVPSIPKCHHQLKPCPQDFYVIFKKLHPSPTYYEFHKFRSCLNELAAPSVDEKLEDQHLCVFHEALLYIITRDVIDGCPLDSEELSPVVVDLGSESWLSRLHPCRRPIMADYIIYGGPEFASVALAGSREFQKMDCETGERHPLSHQMKEFFDSILTDSQFWSEYMSAHTPEFFKYQQAPYTTTATLESH